MTDIAAPTYNLTSLSDKQWDKQLAAQQEMQKAELNSRKEIELERLRNERDTRRDRFQLIKNVLGGLACFLIVAMVIGGAVYGIQRSSDRSHEKAVECIKTNGRWIDEGSGKGERCDRP